MISRTRIILVLLLIAVTWLVIQSSSTPLPVSIKKPLALFPEQIGPWTRVASRLSSTEVVEILGVDEYIDYTYVGPNGKTINLYVAFYASVGVSGAYHSPKNCLPGSGWAIERVDSFPLPVGIEGSSKSSITELLIHNRDEYQIVLYWYQNRGRIIGSEYQEKIMLVVDGLLKRRRDGTFVRIISNLHKDDIPATEELLRTFSSLVMNELEAHLPGKVL